MVWRGSDAMCRDVDADDKATVDLDVGKWDLAVKAIFVVVSSLLLGSF